MFSRFMAVVLSGILFAGAASAGLFGKGLSLVVVPARQNLIQIAFDFAQLRETAVLAYQRDVQTGDLLLHAWNGADWQLVTAAEFQSGSFLTVKPARTVFIGGPDLLPPALAQQAAAWGGKAVPIADVTPGAVLDRLGKEFDFSGREYGWFAKRYNLDLKETNAEVRRQSWYDGAWAPKPSPRPMTSAPPAKVVVLPASGSEQPLAGPAGGKK